MIGARCWEKWKSNKRECPQCRKEGDCVESVFYQNYVNNLTYICDCGEAILIQDSKAHFLECAVYNKKCSSVICSSLHENKLEIEQRSSIGIIKRHVCSPYCKYAFKIQEFLRPLIKRDHKIFFTEINKILDKFFTKICKQLIKCKDTEPKPIISEQPKKEVILEIKPTSNGSCDFLFVNKLSPEIECTGKRVILNEAQYIFRTTMSDRPFTQVGVYYWEISPDVETENELKVGVSTSADFPGTTAFCDHESGFAYYGLGQLRHSSNSVGTKYGKPFKNSGVLGICLNMESGTLSFSLNNEYLGVAYSSPLLTKPPIYPAVSLLHKAGFTLFTGKKIPNIFPA